MNVLDKIDQVPRLHEVGCGLWQGSRSHGPITGNGPNFKRDIKRFRLRQEQLRKPGKWRAVEARWAIDNGTFQDPDYMIVDPDIYL